MISSEDFAIVGCRLIALYYAVLATSQLAFSFTSLVFLLSMKDDPHRVDNFFFSFLQLTLYIIIALALWLSARRIARLVCGTDRSEGDREVDFAALQAVAFAAVGLYLVVDSLPVVVQALGYSYHVTVQSPDFQGSYGYSSPDLLPPFVRLILGLLLLIGARGMSGFVTLLRAWGARDI